MISDHNRSYYIGASDTTYVIGNWETKTFEKWWLEKLGLSKNTFSNEAMMTGTAYEHRILDSLGLPAMEKDKQLIAGRLRINLDGNTEDTIYEVKTYRYEKGFQVPVSYLRQVWVQMFGSGLPNAYIVSYGLVDDDYQNYYREIDKTRLKQHPIPYNESFIQSDYLPRFRYLAGCLDQGRYPNKQGFERSKYA